MTKRPPKTIKEKKFVKAYIESGNGTQAAMKAYDVKDPNSASSIASENLRKLDISTLMDNRGITDERLLDKLNEGLEATRSISAIAGTEANGGTVDFVDVPDYAIRHKYLETGLKLKNKFPNASNQTNVQVNVINHLKAEKNEFGI